MKKGSLVVTTEYWISSLRMTVGVTVNNAGVIVDAAPVVRKFIGQPFKNLTRWMEQQGGLRVEELSGGNARNRT